MSVYINGVEAISSIVQTALDLKAPLASPTFTGTVTLPAVTLGGDISGGGGKTLEMGSGSFTFNTSEDGGGIYIKSTSTGTGGTAIFMQALSASPATNDAIGSIAASGYDSGAQQRTYGRFWVRIEDPTGNGSGKMVWDTLVAGASNEAMRLSSAGVLSVDLAGTGTPAQVDLFDEYDDALVLRQGIQQNNRALLADMGVLTRKDTGSGYMMNLQPMVRLLAGGIYQTRQMLDNLNERLERLEERYGKVTT